MHVGDPTYLHKPTLLDIDRPAPCNKRFRGVEKAVTSQPLKAQPAKVNPNKDTSDQSGFRILTKILLIFVPIPITRKANLVQLQ